MAILKCKLCGGNLTVGADVSIAECEYCGAVQTVPKADDEKKLTLFSRANRLRYACEFDKASGIYEAIIADFPEEAEAYWGLVLCSYGIEYVDDPATGKKIPTCHRTCTASVMDDDNFNQAYENADAIAKPIYREEAKAIDRLQRSIIETAQTQEPYDIFICYKETDDITNNRTEDSSLAQDIFTALVQDGYRVFFSRVSLRETAGSEYEPYIYAALSSAKVMLAIGTKFEYFDAVWVKNEWSRFLSMMAKDQSKHLIPCFKEIDAYDMPKEFKNLQGLDMGEVTFFRDLVSNINRFVPSRQSTVPAKAPEAEATPSGEAPKAQEVQKQDSAVDNLITRVNIFLEDKDWKNANDYCDRILDIDATCARAYLGKMMISLMIQNMEQLAEYSKPFDENFFYEKVLRFADEDLRNTLEGYNSAIKERMENERILREKKEAEKREEQFSLNIHKNRLKACRDRLKPYRGMISAGNGFVMGLRSDGTVLAAGDNSHGQCNVLGWRNVVMISAGNNHAAALRSDKSLMVTGYISNEHFDNLDWWNIFHISAGNANTVGISENSPVVAVGNNTHGQCNVWHWHSVIAVDAGPTHTVGVRRNGTVVAVGKYDQGQCMVTQWTDIVEACAGVGFTVGLRANGTVITAGRKISDDIESWRNVVAISAGRSHIVALTEEGEVLSAGDNTPGGPCDVSGWHNIVAISAGYGLTMGLSYGGKVLVTGDNAEMLDTSDWKLFTDMSNPEKEREHAHKKMAEIDAYRRRSGVCQYCGGEFKGMLPQKCTRCGRVKNY